MTNQAIYVIRILEIEAFIFPSITYVAAGATGPVCRQGDTKAIDTVFLSKQVIARPVPVPGFHDVLVNAVVAEQAGFSNFLGGGKRAFNKFRMVLLCQYGDSKQERKEQCCQGFHIIHF